MAKSKAKAKPDMKAKKKAEVGPKAKPKIEPLVEAPRSERKTLGVLAVQGILALLFAYLVFSMIAVDFQSKSFWVVKDPTALAFLAVITITLYLIYFYSKKKNTNVFDLDFSARALIKETTKRKVKNARENPFVIAILLIEIAYAFIIALALYFYVDPENSIIQWGELIAGIEPPFTTALNIIVFAVITALFLYMHSLAGKFDSLSLKARKLKKEK